MTQKALTVTQLNEYIKELISNDAQLANICLTGEISNFKRHSSGHLYFTLKDNDSVISAVMFRGDSSRLRFSPDSGMKVIVLGRVSVYPKSGQYQVYVSVMQPDGIGSLHLAFEQLKEKLFKKGMFDATHKKPLPMFPKRIALVTSPTGAAVRDMIRILRIRYPICDVVVCPVKVQGDGASSEIASMIDYINLHSLADLIITGRGGGSLEDLWAFNEEIVAEAIFRSRIPVISAVGHEPDITISDYVADARASTPSNAAEIAVKDQRELKGALRDLLFTFDKYMRDDISKKRRHISEMASAKVMTDPRAYFDDRRMYLGLTEERIQREIKLMLERASGRYASLAGSLDALSPLKVLGRGYSMVTSENKVIRSAREIKKGDTITVRLSDGSTNCTVESVTFDDKEQRNG